MSTGPNTSFSFVYLATRSLVGVWLAALAMGVDSREPLWSESELKILKSLWLGRLPDPPVNPSNAVATNPLAVKLGKQLFFDKGLSANGQIACASCHQPQLAFTDGLKYSVGIEQTQRNAPSLVGIAYHEWFYWDGRRDSLWSQALTPLEAAEEMGNTRTQVIDFIAKHKYYRQQYEKLFGPLPKVAYQLGRAQPASPIGNKKEKLAWSKFSSVDQRKLSSVFSNIGKAIAAYERLLIPRPTRFDHYVEALISGKTPNKNNDLSHQEFAGLRLFLNVQKTQCLNCHNGPLLTNYGFHNIGTGNFDPPLDLGRYFGIEAVRANEFNCLGDYSDSDAKQCAALRFIKQDDHMYGAFKVPSLRHLKLTAPYFHDGRHASLEDVVQYYVDFPRDKVNSRELKPIHLSASEQEALVAFLNLLSN